MTTIIITGCNGIQADEIYNFLSGRANVLDYTTNCTMKYNISLNTLNEPSKRSVFVNYNDLNNTWNEMFCSFDSRCQAIKNVSISNICSNVNATYTYIGPIFSPQSAVAGSMCCNGGGQCYMDTIPLSNCTNVNNSQVVATVAFNLTNTSEWDAMCCVSGV